jgi:hypothetical protein
MRADVVIRVPAIATLGPHDIRVSASSGSHVVVHVHPYDAPVCLLYVAQPDGTVEDRGVSDAHDCEL